MNECLLQCFFNAFIIAIVVSGVLKFKGGESRLIDVSINESRSETQIDNIIDFAIVILHGFSRDRS